MNDFFKHDLAGFFVFLLIWSLVFLRLLYMERREKNCGGHEKEDEWMMRGPKSPLIKRCKKCKKTMEWYKYGVEKE